MQHVVSDAILSLIDVTKRYRIGTIESTILNKISLHIYPKDMVAIIGASGSGKSTLMSIIGLLDKPDSGQYKLQGQDVLELSDTALADRRNRTIGFVFQQFNLLPRFTALQNVILPLTYRKMPFAEATLLAQDALGRVGMQSFAAHLPLQLSGGQQQRVAIARAIVGSPDIILADEPTGALDMHTSDEIMRLFLSLNAEGRTLILVTHDPKVSAQCAKHITLVDGCVLHSA